MSKVKPRSQVSLWLLPIPNANEILYNYKMTKCGPILNIKLTNYFSAFASAMFKTKAHAQQLLSFSQVTKQLMCKTDIGSEN